MLLNTAVLLHFADFKSASLFKLSKGLNTGHCQKAALGQECITVSSHDKI